MQESTWQLVRAQAAVRQAFFQMKRRRATSFLHCIFLAWATDKEGTMELPFDLDTAGEWQQKPQVA